MNKNFKELGSFGKSLKLISYTRAYSLKDLAQKDQPEIIVVGKSNVGKSTLINTLLNHNLTKTSKTPGCTRWLGHIKLGTITLIDVPGYGFAKVSKGRKDFWQTMMNEYIKSGRADLVLVLVDSRKGIQSEDTHIADLIGKPTLFIYTKYDKFSAQNVELPESTMAVSATTGIGIHQLREVLTQLT